MISLELNKGALRLTVLPGLGGAIASLTYDGLDLLRRWDGSPTARRSGCFALVPYSNRIAFATFSIEGETYPLSYPAGDHPHAIHGVGWQRQWQVMEQSDTEVQLGLRHDPDGVEGADWPFAFEAIQHLTLGERALTMRLSVRNDSLRAMPAGLGWHPYFPRHAGIEMSFVAASVWHSNADQLPERVSDVPACWDFAQARRVADEGLDNCFGGWAGQAQLYWPESDLGVKLQAGAGLDYLVVFTPPQPLGFIAVEPVSHRNNAINTAAPDEHGLIWLAPGETMVREFSLEVTQGRP